MENQDKNNKKHQKLKTVIILIIVVLLLFAPIGLVFAIYVNQNQDMFQLLVDNNVTGFYSLWWSRYSKSLLICFGIAILIVIFFNRKK